MKKIIICLVFLVSTLTYLPIQAHAAKTTDNTPVVIKERTENPEIDAMVQRLHEIKDMDKSELNRTEKKELRKEVKTIEQNLNANGGGVYISVGGLILIILLLIIIF